MVTWTPQRVDMVIGLRCGLKMTAVEILRRTWSAETKPPMTSEPSTWTETVIWICSLRDSRATTLCGSKIYESRRTDPIADFVIGCSVGGKRAVDGLAVTLQMHRVVFRTWLTVGLANDRSFGSFARNLQIDLSPIVWTDSKMSTLRT